jgi:hypothetical protein
MNVPLPPKVGAKFKDRMGLLHHVRAIVDYQEGTPETRWYQVVFRYWSQRKQRWGYVIESCYALELGTYSQVKRKPAAKDIFKGILP